MAIAPELAFTDRLSHRGNDTVERTLAVAIDILKSDGETSLRLAQVTRRSGVSIGSIYYHFGSRDGLIAAARERQFRDSLTYPGQTDASGYLAATTPAEFIEKFDEMLHLSESVDVAAGRMRRFELIGAAARKPGDLPGVLELESAYLDAGEQIGRVLYERGWLQDGVEPRAFALFLHSVSMARVVREIDDGVSFEMWCALVRRALEGVLRFADSSPGPVSK